jgi:hypothetical protein
MDIKKFLEGKIITEAEYKGRKVNLNKPFRTPDGPKKFSVYVKNEKGNIVKVNFGDPNMRIKRNSPERRKSFRARHRCETPGPKTKARYWSCQAGWNKTKTVKDLIKEEVFKKLNESTNDKWYNSVEYGNHLKDLLKREPGKLIDVPKDIINYELLCKIAVSQNGNAIKMVDPSNESYYQLCQIAVRQNPYSIFLIDENSFSEKELYFNLCERAYLGDPDVLKYIPKEYQEKIKNSFKDPEYIQQKERQYPTTGDVFMESEDLQEGWRDNITKVLAGLSLITTLNTGISFAKGSDKDNAVKEYIAKKFTGNVNDIAGYTKGGYPVYKKDSPSAKEFKSKYNNAIENNIPSFEYNGFNYQVTNNTREKLDTLGIAQIGFKTDLNRPEISDKRYDVPAVRSVSEPETSTKNVDNSKSSNISTFNKNKIYDLSAEINNNISISNNEWFELPDDYMKYLKSYGKEIQSTYNVKALRDTKTNKIYLSLPKTKEGVNSYVKIFKKYVLPKMKGIEAVKTLDGKVVSIQDFLGGQLNELFFFNKEKRNKEFNDEQKKHKDNPNAIHYVAEPQPTAKYQPKTTSMYDIVDSKKLEESYDNLENYMFFNNLETIKRNIETILSSDFTQIDNILKNGHDWAESHIAMASENVSQVADFLENELN